nr:hypothetical protein [Actinacidiphila glaucinigra]
MRDIVRYPRLLITAATWQMMSPAHAPIVLSMTSSMSTTLPAFMSHWKDSMQTLAAKLPTAIVLLVAAGKENLSSTARTVNIKAFAT